MTPAGPPIPNAAKNIRRFAWLALAAATVAMTGCEGAHDAADRAAGEKLNEADKALAQNQLPAAQAASDAAGAIDNISPEMAAKAHMLQGRLRVASAQQMLAAAQDSELNLSRIMGELRVNTVAAQSAQAEIKAAQGFDPAPTIEVLQAKIAQAQGVAGPDWPPPPAPKVDRTPEAEIVVPPEPAAPAQAAGGNPAGSAPAGAGVGGFLSRFFGAAKPAATAASGATATASQPASTAPQATPAPAPSVPPREEKPLDVLVLHSLSGLDSQISNLQDAIKQNNSQSQALAGQKTALLEQADQLQQKSIAENGQASVDEVTAAAGARRQAAELASQIDKLGTASVDLQADLAKCQSQRQGVQQAIDAFNKQIDDLQLAWKSVQDDIEAQKRGLLAIAGPAGGGAAASSADTAALPQPTTVADQAAQLKSLVADSRGLRDKAAVELKAAIDDFNKAASAGDQFRTAAGQILDGPTTPVGQKLALQQLEEIYSGSAARLAAADATRTLAMDYAVEAMMARQLKLTLDGAAAALGSDAPAAVADCIAATASPSADDLSSLAVERFESALGDYDTLNIQTMPGAAGQERKTEAMAGKMIAAFGAKELSLSMADKPVAGQTPKELQGTIDDLAKNVSDADPSLLPAVPYTIAAAAPAAQ